MKHCPNCGAENPGDPCEGCGLSPTEAEFHFRRKLVYQTAICSLGLLAYLAAVRRYPPLEVDAILIFLGALFFGTLGLAIFLDRRAARHVQIEILRRIFRSLVPVPGLLALLLFVNGALDTQPPLRVSAKVEGTYSMPGSLPVYRIIVRSWREGRSEERIAVGVAEFNRLGAGDYVEIRVHEGLVGIPWIGSVSRL